MSSASFTTVAHAKCILAGEHTVLRGYPAVVWPIKQKAFVLTFTSSNEPVTISTSAGISDAVADCFLHTLECSMKHLSGDHAMSRLTGDFSIRNEVDLGAGIGFSAALCVSIARWLVWEGCIKDTDVFCFARRLEDDYHGRSSGLDIVGAMSDYPVFFTSSGEKRALTCSWQPKLYISYSGVTKHSSQAIASVHALMEQNPSLGRLLDEQMAGSVHLIEQALALGSKEGLPLLVKAIEQAHRCFNQWGLITLNLQQHINILQQAGALAVKPTGAGKGGYVVSLWESSPKIEGISLIPLTL